MKSIYLNGFRYFLAFFGLFLGFSSKVLAQYGIPVNIFRIQINVRSEVCKEPISDIQVKVNDPSTGREYMAQTDSSGQVFLRGHSEWGNNKLHLSFSDIDGALNNGHFISKEKTYVMGGNNNPFDVFLSQHDRPLCIIEEEEEHPEAFLPNDTLTVSEEESDMALISQISETEHVPPAYFLCYPNPGQGEFRLIFDLEIPETAGIKVFDMNSKIVYFAQVSFEAGRAEHLLNLSGVANGTYVVQLIYGQNMHTAKVIVKP